MLQASARYLCIALTVTQYLYSAADWRISSHQTIIHSVVPRSRTRYQDFSFLVLFILQSLDRIGTGSLCDLYQHTQQGNKDHEKDGQHEKL
jgi:hypothetical protein